MLKALVLLLALAPPCFAQDVPTERLQNPGFDRDADGDGLPDGWSTDEGRIQWHEKMFMGKDYEIISRPGAYVLATQDVDLEKGQKYTLTLKCKSDAGGLAGVLLLHGEDRPHREMPLLWNVQAAGEYEEYVTSFEAPNPVACVYIYNVARTKGTVYYDRVSLREGEPDYPIINQFSLKEIDRPLTEPLPSRHIDWASPLAGGPIKAFVTIRNFRCLRQLIELTQRIDLDYDAVETGYTGDVCNSMTGRRAMKRLQDGEYEVFIVPSRVGEAVAKSIREQVARGAGLVVVEGFGRSSTFVERGSLQDAGDEHYVLRDIPWEMMPEKTLAGAQVGTLGNGRVVRLLFPMDVSRVWGLLPSENSMAAYKSRQFEYWEWWEALLARAAAWAADRDEDCRIAVVGDGPEAMELRVTGPQARKARVIIRSAREIRFDGDLIRTAPQEFPISDDGGLILPYPDIMPAGPVIADISLLDDAGEVVYWGSALGRIPQAASIAEVTADRASYSPGDTVDLTVTCDAPDERGVAFVASLVDAYGRVTSRTARQQHLSGGATELTIPLPVLDPLCTHHKAFVSLLVDGREHDSRWVTVLVPEVGPRQAAADFLAVPWGPGMSHPVIIHQYMERTRQLGLAGEFAISPYVATEAGRPIGGYMGVGRSFRENRYSDSGVRSQCLHDPAVVQSYTDRAREAAAKQKEFGLYAVGITDEAFLSSRHKRHEVCFGEHTQNEYRDWLRQRYGSLQGLNEQWGSEYAAWDDVTGARTEDVRGTDNFGAFVDFRTFMTDTWVNACKTIGDAYHEVCPETPVGHTNTFGANPFNGNDYWKLNTQTGFGWGQEYSEAIKPSGHKAVFDLWRSFAQTPEAVAARGDHVVLGDQFPNYGWIGYNHTVAAAHYEPWWLALHGSRGVSYFATNAIAAERGTSWALVFPTLSFTKYSLAVRDALKDLREGCGKLLMEYKREQPRIGILWSHPSMLVAWCESTADQPVPEERDGTDSYGTYFRSALHFRRHINELQLDYAYVAPEQIVSSDILNGYEMLFLPFTVACSDELVVKLEDYVDNGGVLVGDLRCLRTDEHGKPGDGVALQGLFGVQRNGGEVTYAPTTLQFKGAAEGIDLTGMQASAYAWEPIELAGASALAEHATGEPAVAIQRHGKGLSVYLNASLPAYDVACRELLGQITRIAGVERRVSVQALEGDAPPLCYERNTFRRGPIEVHGFIRDFRRCDDSEPVTVQFGGDSHVYDLRARKYLGEPGETRLYACLPYRVSGLTVAAPATVRQGAKLALQVSVAGEGGQVGDHVVRVTFRRPTGDEAWHYTRNELAPGGTLALQTPIALNEQIGQWRVEVRDVLSGMKGEATFNVEPE